MTDTELSQPSLCQRICCCFSSTSKEPPVQLIRSGTLQPAAAPKTNGQHISAAEDTIDGFEDVNLEVRTTADNSTLRVLVEKAPNAFNMNDIVMEEVFRGEKPDEEELVIEDAVSISTNVIEEVDESELSRLRLHSPKETPPPEKKDSNEENTLSEEKSHDEGNEIARRLSLELPSTSKNDDAHSEGSTDSDEEEETPTKETYSAAATEEEKAVVVVTTERHTSPTVTDKEPPSETEHVLSKAKEMETVEQASEEEIIVEVTPTVQKAFDPPSIPPKSIMYADTSSDEESDDEEEREVLPPVQRSQKVINFDKVLEESTQNGRLESGTTITSKTLDDSSSDDERSEEDDTKPRKLRNLTVTRIVVRDDGKPDELTSGPVKLSLDGREAITDEEFSEKLI